MPIYEYRCSSCGFQKEYLQKMSAPLLTVCPECGKSSFSKMLTAAGFQLKGSGWYATDFRNSGSGSTSKPAVKSSAADGGDKGGGDKGGGDKGGAAASDGKDGAKSDAKTETKSETKSEAVNGARA